MLTNLSPPFGSCPITFRARGIPCGYTGVERAVSKVRRKSWVGKEIDLEAGGQKAGASLFRAGLCCSLNNLCDSGWPPKSLQSREKRSDDGLKSRVQELNARAQIYQYTPRRCDQKPLSLRDSFSTGGMSFSFCDDTRCSTFSVSPDMGNVRSRPPSPATPCTRQENQ
jgi:hypothetical protein